MSNACSIVISGNTPPVFHDRQFRLFAKISKTPSLKPEHT
jgi:hypothetical protein